MKRKIFLFDIDRTLINEKHEVFDETKKALKTIESNGDIFALNTGRGHFSTIPVAKQVNSRYAIVFNGQSIYDFKENKYIENNFMDIKIVFKLYDFISKFNVSIMTYFNNKVVTWNRINSPTFYSNLSEEKKEHFVDHYIEYPFNGKAEYKDYISQIEDKIIKVIVLSGNENTMEIKNKLIENFGEHFNFYIGAGNLGNIEISLKGFNKYTGGLSLINKLGMKREDVNIIAFGDAENDVPIFEKADYSIGMGNSEEIVKNKITYKTKDFNDHNAIKEGVEQAYKALKK